MKNFDKIKISDICKKNSVLKLYLIGSRSRNDYNYDSDADFLVLFDKTEDALGQYFNTMEELEAISGMKIDLIEEQAIKNSAFYEGIKNDMIPLYEA